MAIERAFGYNKKGLRLLFLLEKHNEQRAIPQKKGKSKIKLRIMFKVRQKSAKLYDF